MLGTVAGFIVAVAGLNSEFIRQATVATRAFHAFAYVALFSFILLMAAEEYAIFKANRELEHFVVDAEFTDTDDFNLETYRNQFDSGSNDPGVDDSFRPINFGGLSSQI